MPSLAPCLPITFTKRSIRRAGLHRLLVPFAVIASIVVIICVIAGFVVSGPPMRGRFARYDAERVLELKITQEKLVAYWREKRSLPEKVKDLSNSSGLPEDPATGAAYEYYTVNPHAFYLCARFRSTSPGWRPGDSWNCERYDWAWGHDSGRYCFHRDVNSLSLQKSNQ